MTDEYMPWPYGRTENDAIPDRNAREFAGVHTSLPREIHIFWDKHEGGWMWECISEPSPRPFHGPFAGSRNAYEHAAQHFEGE